MNESDLRKIYLESIGLDAAISPTDDITSGMPEAPENIMKPEPGRALEELKRTIGDCHRCALGDSRTTLVFGVGNPDAQLLLVGEAPGRDEDLTGEPFVGRAGQLLTKIIQAMGFQRGEVYICNVNKCRPPGNRNPEPEEVTACKPFLLRQVEIVSPKIICALGSFAARTLLGTDMRISGLRGRFHDFNGIPLMPTYHPSFLLRNPNAKKDVWSDMRMIMKRLGLPIEEG